jgi:hypothetical protein
MPVFTVQTELFNLENQLKEKQHTVAVNEEKEKALSSKLTAWIRPGNRSFIDSNIINHINDLRVQRTQMDEDIFAIRRRIEQFNLRMPVIIAECESDMSEAVNVAVENIVEAEVITTSVHDSAVAEEMEITARTVKIAEEFPVSEETSGINPIEVVPNVAVKTEEVEKSVSEEVQPSEPHKIVISEKVIAEENAKIALMTEQTESDKKSEAANSDEKTAKILEK